MKAMILAAGRGERLRPLTDSTPKPLLAAHGKPLIEYHIERLARAGVRQLVINTSWLGEKIEAYVGDGSRFGVEVLWSRELQPLETGGGIRRALPLLGRDPFLVVNSDIWTDYPLEKLVAQDWSAEQDAHLVLVPNPPHHPQGDFILDSAGVVRHPQRSSVATLTFSGISILWPEIFALHQSGSEKFPLRNVLSASIDAGFVNGERYDGSWWDIGTVERLQALSTFLKGR